VPRALSTTLCEELASHGLVAVSIDHAYGGLAVLADGRVLSSSADPALEEGEEGFARRTSEWAADLTFVLDRLAKLPKSVPVARRLELQRVGAAGHSMGGAAAVLAACRDARIVACVDMDGAPFDLEELGLCKPTLVLKSAPIYSDAELEAAGRSPAEWKGMGDGIHALWRGLHEKGGGALAYASIRGTAHMSFCDAPFTMPATITAFGGTFLSAQRTYEVVGALVRAFLEQALAPDAKPFALRDPASLPEVELLLD